jgi:uncharacterized protein YgiB involved in biofilm formation
MKRSKNVRLVAMGMASAGVLGGCGQEPQITPANTPLFTSFKQCAELGEYNEQDCRNGLNFALQEQARDAETPQFRSQQDCEAQFGSEQCHALEGGTGSSIWMPLLGGYLVGALFNNAGGRQYHAYNYAYGGRWSTYQGIGRSVWRSPNKPPSLPRPAGISVPKPSSQRVAALSRSGFGLSAARFSSRSQGG